MKAQVFITCVEKGDIAAVWPKNNTDMAMFHVEHGAVTVSEIR
jgi:recombinational DNA repair ATPase RecF